LEFTHGQHCRITAFPEVTRRVEGRKRGPKGFLGDLTPGGAQGGRHDSADISDDFSEAAVE